MDYLINNYLSFKKNKNFLIKSKNYKSKLKLFVQKPRFIIKRKYNVNILYVDDTVQKEKAFKVRGALTEVLINLKKIKKKNIIVLASTGNFAYSMASICKQKKINCVSFVTKSIDKFKLDKLRKLGVKIFFSKNYEIAKKNAKKYSKKNNYFFSNGCNKNIFLGNASLMLEAFEYLKKKDKNILHKSILGILPVGNGSLAAPSSIILKNIFFDNVDVACVEPFNFKKSQKIIDNKIKLSSKNTIADGAAIKKLPNESKKIIFENFKYFFSAKEKEIKNSIKYLFKNLKIKSEGAGALTNTVILFNPKFISNYDYVIVPICGGNIDKKKLFRYIDQ